MVSNAMTVEFGIQELSLWTSPGTLKHVLGAPLGLLLMHLGGMPLKVGLRFESSRA